VVSDFRSRDIAAGGQGAPLVPAFHAAICADLPKPVALCNIGGFANLTLLNSDNPIQIQGLDTGPGNVLMDMWIQQHCNKPYDADGAWAASGKIHPVLLARLLAHPYFSQPLPKSTGREAFDMNWLNTALQGLTISPVDIQTTLCELTASSITQAIQQHLPACKTLYICGGGAFNPYLMQRLSALLLGCSVQSTTALGINPQHMEALAFAWLARQCLLGLAGNVPSVTGAAGLRVLGQICPA
jgi:anhydro-N-acetylmuramic acid kinase